MKPRLSHRQGLIVALAACGAVIAAFLTLAQLRVVPAWDPVFGAASTDAVLHSSLSRALPVPDALLGLLAYLAELSLGIAATRQRLRNQAWRPVTFEGVALATAAAGLALVGVQALVVHRWCAVPHVGDRERRHRGGRRICRTA